MKTIRLLAVASAAFFIAGAASAQNAGTVTNHALAIGKGPGQAGYTSLLLGSAQIAVGQAGADPQARAVTGDITMDNGGVTAIGTAKITTAMLAANAVTNAKLAQMANGNIKCRNTAGTGDPEDCTPAQIRTLLGLVIGTNVQAWDADLDCIAAISATGIIRRTGAGTCSAGTLVTNAELATAGAATLKGNPTNATGAVQDFTIQGLTTGAIDPANDSFAYYSASAGAFRKTTAGAIAASGSLPSIADKQVLANTSGSTGTPTGTSATTWFDSAYCNTVGYIVARFASTWVCAPGIPANTDWFGTSTALSDNGAIINTVLASGAKTVIVGGSGIYNVTTVINVPAGVSFKGNGRGTILRRTTSGDLIHSIGTTTKANITISDMTLDLNSQSASSGIIAEYVTNFRVKNLSITNYSGWAVNVGVINGADTVVRNTYVTVEDCDIFNGLSTYEAVLIFNSSKSKIKNNVMRVGAAGNGVGIYQIADQISVEGNYISGFTRGSYYGYSTNNITYKGNTFESNTTGIAGANQSDNGLFGAGYVSGLKILDNLFSGNNVGFQVGAVLDGLVDGNRINQSTSIGAIVDGGNAVSTTKNMTSRLSFVNNVVSANNQSGGAFAINGGVYVRNVNAFGNLEVNYYFSGNQFSGTSANQQYPLIMDNANFFNVIGIGNNMPSYSGSPKSVLLTGGSICTNCTFTPNMNYSP